MSDSRIDYQPLNTRGQDSSALSRHSNDVAKSEHIQSHHDDDEYDAIHATESQGLVSTSSDRDFVEHHRQQRLLEDEENEDNGSAMKDPKAAAAEWAVKVQAFSCAALLGISTHFTNHMTGPLKDVLKEVSSAPSNSSLLFCFDSAILSAMGSTLSKTTKPHSSYLTIIEHGHQQHTVFTAAVISDAVPDFDTTHRRTLDRAVWDRTKLNRLYNDCHRRSGGCHSGLLDSLH